MINTFANFKRLRRSSTTQVGRICGVALAFNLAVAAQNAFALGSDTVFISGSAGVTYNSNLFYQDPSANPQGDTIYQVGLGLKADVPYSRQRFQADLNVYANRYVKFSDLDYVGGSGRAAWLWEVGDDWSGDVGATVSRSLQNYSYTTTGTQRNVVQLVDYFFDPRYRIAPNFELQGGLDYQTVSNSLAAANGSDYNQLGTRLGVAYVTSSGSQVGLQVQRWTVNVSSPPVGQPNSNYHDNRVSTFFNWQLTGASRIDGSVGYKQRRHDVLTQQNFNGWTGSVGWNWVPTGRTQVRVFVIRDIGGVYDLVTTYARYYTVGISPSYQLTSKIALNGVLQHQDLRFLGNTQSGLTSALQDRHDTINIAGLGAGYQVTRVFGLGLNYTWSHRSSNVPLQSYNANVISFSGSLTF